MCEFKLKLSGLEFKVELFVANLFFLFARGSSQIETFFVFLQVSKYDSSLWTLPVGSLSLFPFVVLVNVHRSIIKVLNLFIVGCFVSDVNLKWTPLTLHPTLKNDLLLACVLVIVGHQLAMQSDVVLWDFYLFWELSLLCSFFQTKVSKLKKNCLVQNKNQKIIKGNMHCNLIPYLFVLFSV